jgi:hypothetical protein
MLRILRNEFLLVFGDFIRDENRISGADRDASATVDAAVGIYVKLSRGLEAIFIFLGMNAVCWTGLDAEFVFGTGVGNDVCHDCDLHSFLAATPPRLANAGRALRFELGNIRGVSTGAL